MRGATVSISVIEPRLLNLIEAAQYCGLPQSKFKSECYDVKPIVLGDGKKRYDKQDLDDWIDRQKGKSSNSREQLLAKLG